MWHWPKSWMPLFKTILFCWHFLFDRCHNPINNQKWHQDVPIESNRSWENNLIWSIQHWTSLDRIKLCFFCHLKTSSILTWHVNRSVSFLWNMSLGFSSFHILDENAWDFSPFFQPTTTRCFDQKTVSGFRWATWCAWSPAASPAAGGGHTCAPRASCMGSAAGRWFLASKVLVFWSKNHPQFEPFVGQFGWCFYCLFVAFVWCCFFISFLFGHSVDSSHYFWPKKPLALETGCRRCGGAFSGHLRQSRTAGLRRQIQHQEPVARLRFRWSNSSLKPRVM